VYAVECLDGDVIAINIGLWANNETRSLAYMVGYHFYASEETDIAHVDTSSLGNTWVEFSAALAFQPEGRPVDE
jgi:hypothetical protein